MKHFWYQKTPADAINELHNSKTEEDRREATVAVMQGKYCVNRGYSDRDRGEGNDAPRCIRVIFNEKIRILLVIHWNVCQVLHSMADGSGSVPRRAQKMVLTLQRFPRFVETLCWRMRLTLGPVYACIPPGQILPFHD